MKKYMSMVLFWGSLWGLAEASLGYIFHMAAIAFPGIPGFLMFPIAFYFMNKVYNSTGKVTSVFHISLIAALIKLADFLLPIYIPIRIVNPALSILMEGLTVSLVFYFYDSKKIGYVQSFMMGVGWRSMFTVYMFIISMFNLPAALVTDGITVTLRFVILESFINSLIIFAYLRWAKGVPTLNIKPVYSYGVLILAVGAQILL